MDYSSYAASILMYLSAWCYSNQEDFVGMMTRAGIKGVECIEVSRLSDTMFISATAEVIRSDDGRLAIVCFRGTELTNAISWLTDISTTPVEIYHNKIKVHGGFARNFQSIWPEVVQALCCRIEHEKKIEDDEKEHEQIEKLEALHVCGHSLGGAMASLAALSLYYVEHPVMKKLREKLKGVYTYGQPMFLSPKDQHLYLPALDVYAEHAVFRHVYKKDPVPHLPPTETGRWCHVGRELRWEQGQWVTHKKPEYSTQARTWILAPTSVAAFLTEPLDPSHIMRRISNYFGYNFGHHSPWHYTGNLLPIPKEAKEEPRHGLAAAVRNVVTDGVVAVRNITERVAALVQHDNPLSSRENEDHQSPDENRDHALEAEHDSLSEEETSEEETLEGHTPVPMEPRRQEVHVALKALPRGEIIHLVIVLTLFYLWWSKMKGERHI